MKNEKVKLIVEVDPGNLTPEQAANYIRDLIAISPSLNERDYTVTVAPEVNDAEVPQPPVQETQRESRLATGGKKRGRKV